MRYVIASSPVLGQVMPMPAIAHDLVDRGHEVRTLVVAGTTEDKPELAASGGPAAGIDLRTGTPEPERIRHAVREVLGTPGDRDRAKALQADAAGFQPFDTIAAAFTQAASETGNGAGTVAPEPHPDPPSERPRGQGLLGGLVERLVLGRAEGSRELANPKRPVEHEATRTAANG